MSVKIMIVDDHALVREGICSLLNVDSFSIIAQASNGMECINVLDSCKPDVILLDICMPGMNGIDVLAEIRKSKRKVKIIMLTYHGEPDYLIKAMDLGANGYLLKDCGIDILKEAINCVMVGERYIEDSLVPIMNNRITNRNIDKEKIDSLTKREIEILKQIAGGRFNKEIAESLDITERTVKNHISNLFKKIDVNDRTQAAVFAIRNNLVELF